MLSQHTLCICKDKYLILTSLLADKGKKVKTTETVVEPYMLFWSWLYPPLASHIATRETFPIEYNRMRI